VRNFRLFAVGIGGVLGMVGLLNAMALAQTPAPDDRINPPVANCNQIPDTNAGDKPPPAKIVATPITADLLASGQPCQQKVSPAGLIPDNGLANLQRGFDFYSWLTFIATRRRQGHRQGAATGRRCADQMGSPAELPAARQCHARARRQAGMGHPDRAG
jgi:hypothetical protein